MTSLADIRSLPVFTTEQLLQLPTTILASSDKNSISKAIPKFSLKRLSGQLKRDKTYCFRVRMFRCYCIFKITENQPKNPNVLNIQMIEAIPMKSVIHMDAALALISSDSRIIIN